MKPPSFPFYVNNWLSSARVSAMTLEQQGAYVRLLCFAWNSGAAALPQDQALLASLSALQSRWDAVSGPIMACFHVGEDGKLHNEKLDECWTSACSFSASRSRAGVRSGAVRRQHSATSVEHMFNKCSTRDDQVLNSEFAS